MWPCQIQYLPERVLQFTDEYLPAGITRLDLLLTHDELVPLLYLLWGAGDWS